MTARCSRCRARFERAGTGRRRRFCSNACRQAAYRKRNKPPRPPKPHKVSVLFSSKTEEWATPQDLFDALSDEFGPFDLDPAATKENAKCERFFTREMDGLSDELSQEWAGRVFLNAPYGRAMLQWMRKAWIASQTTAEIVVCLVPARTDTRWWHEYVSRANPADVRLLRGRLRFGDATAPAPFRQRS